MPQAVLAPRSRPASFLGALAAVLLCALVFTLGGSSDANAAQTAAVQVHPLWGGVTSAEVDRDLDAAKAAGAGMIRADVGWSSLEPASKGAWSTWYLGRVDAVVEKAQARGLKVLFTFMSSPCWASSAPDTVKQGCAGSWWDRGVQHYAPSNPADYASALAFLVKRYGSRVEAWEVWNEPNQTSFFKAADPVAAYAALLKAAYPAVKAVAPNSTVIGGVLANADIEFTQKLYAAGVKGSFDAWSVHPYSEDRSPLDPSEGQYASNSFTLGVPAVHDVMVANGDDKPLWLTEFGWNTSSIRNSDQAWRNGVSLDAQATNLTAAFARMRDWSYVPVGVWFNLADGDNPSDPVSNFGLLRNDRTEKPAYAAFRVAAAAVAAGAPGLGLSDKPAAGSTKSTPPASSADAPRAAGSTSDSATDPSDKVTLHLVRRSGAWVATGSAPRGATVRLNVFRGGQRGFAKRAAIVRSLRTDRRGAFAVRLPGRRSVRRQAAPRWRVTAHVVGHAARAAIARTR
jgi:hypothetical protein